MPIGSNRAGTLLTSKLSSAARLEHEEALLKNSHRPDHIARAEGDRREAIAFEVALVPVINLKGAVHNRNQKNAMTNYFTKKFDNQSIN